MATPIRPEGVELRTVETPPAGTKVPKRRFGRTEIQMPILTCGGYVRRAGCSDLQGRAAVSCKGGRQ